MKGYGSNQSELRVVVTFPAAEPMTLGLLHIREHACNMTHRCRKEQLLFTKKKQQPLIVLFIYTTV